MMTEKEFLRLLEVYGSDLQRWPESVRAAAQAALDSGSPALASARQREAALDDFLQPALMDPEVSVALEESLLALAPVPKSAGKGAFDWLRRLRAPRWASASVMAACLFGGVGAGYASTAGEAGEVTASSVIGYYAASDVQTIADWSERENEP